MIVDARDRYDRSNPDAWWWHQDRRETEADLVGALIFAALMGRRTLYDAAAAICDAASIADRTCRDGWMRIAGHHDHGTPLDEAQEHAALDRLGWPSCATPTCAALLAAVIQEHALWDSH